MKKFLSIMLAMVMVLSMITPVFASTFEDTVDTDHEVAIEFLIGLGLVNGYEDGTYKPEKVVTRAEMAKLLVISLKLESGADILKNVVSFDDVAIDHWANGYIAVAAQYGLIKGDAGTKNFRPDDTVNYAEAITMVVRTLGLGSVVETEGQWPTNYIAEASELELLDNVTEFDAGKGATRGALAEILWNMLNRPMWYKDSENRQEGDIYYSKTSDTMLEIKFPKYDFETYTFDDWDVSVDDDEYVVELSLDMGEYTVATEDDPTKLITYSFEYEGNDFYSFVPGTTYDILTKKDNNKTTIISIVVNEDNYLDEGTASDLEEKYTNTPDLLGYGFLRLDGTKKSALVKAHVTPYGNEIVKEVEHKESSKNTKVETDDNKYIIEDDEGLESDDNALVIKNGKRIDITKLEKNDLLTWFKSHDEKSVVVLVSTNTIKGSFDSLIFEEDKLDGTFGYIEINGTKYELEYEPYFVELDDEEEVSVDFDDMMKKEKDNDYIGEEIVVFLDSFGNIYKGAFGTVEGVTKNVGLLLAVDGVERDVKTSEDTTYYYKLDDGEKSKGYQVADDAEDFTVEGGKMYWVEFNSKDQITDMIPVEDDASYKDYDVVGVNTKFNEDTLYFGDNKITDSTIVYTIIEELNDEDLSFTPKKYRLEVSNGSKELEGLDEGLVGFEDESIKASFVVVEGESKSTDKLVGIVDKATIRNEIVYLTISGNKYEFDIADKTVQQISTIARSLVGTVVAYTVDDEEVSIKFVYELKELDNAGEITKVKDSIITIKAFDEELGELVEKEYDLDLFDIEDDDGGYGYEDYTIIEIEIGYKNGEAYFEDVKLVDDIDSAKFAKGDSVAVTDGTQEYFAIIKGFDREGA